MLSFFVYFYYIVFMRYEKIVKGIFIDRPNRFIAHVEIEDKVETVHVKNTGRCKELLLPGCTVILEDFRERSGFENRKTKYDLIAVYKEPDKILINMDSQLPNKVVLEWLKKFPSEQAYNLIKPEYTYGNSRVDFYMEKNIGNNLGQASGDNGDRPLMQKYLMEVKGCTLERNGIGYFPDAPTERGVKHLYELAAACRQGYKCFLAFVIQIPEVTKVFPNKETHPEFGEALKQAQNAGVEVLYLQCDIKEDEVVIKNGN